MSLGFALLHFAAKFKKQTNNNNKLKVYGNCIKEVDRCHFSHNISDFMFLCPISVIPAVFQTVLLFWYLLQQSCDQWL